MASNGENTAAIQAILNSKVEVSSLSDSERQILFDSLFPEGVILNVFSTLSKIGSIVFGSGITGINGGKYWIGIQTQVNPTLEAHISHFIHKEL